MCNYIFKELTEPTDDSKITSALAAEVQVESTDENNNAF
jgi:hypothetical protein